MHLRFSIALASLLVLATVADAQDVSKIKSSVPPPTHTDVKYGPHDRHVMDVWLADSDKPTPVVVSIHGGAFRHGDKSVSRPVLRECLKSGISVVAITYRFSPDHIAAVGGSAGAGMSLWLGFHDDMADPKNADPVLRQSTRLTCMAVNNGQTSYDPRFIRTLYPGTDTYSNSALAQLFDIDMKQLDNLPAEKYKLFEEVSALTHLTADDPPVLMTYDSDYDTPISSRSIGIHHPRFGKVLQERMDKLGIECVVHTDFKKTGNTRADQVVPFLKKHLLSDGK
ncbi:alpha/beta hydrolase [Symmachiella dynata]|uniref:alpha/beta hydrolase n=1 Tax=Symmachiella dynata TaxID=2527995 RepID=UPI0030ED9C91